MGLGWIGLGWADDFGGGCSGPFGPLESVLQHNVFSNNKIQTMDFVFTLVIVVSIWNKNNKYG